MVVFREGIYWFAGGDYQFGPWLSELFYEYRKDAWGYVTWLILFNAYFIMLARLKGEASAISLASVTESEQENTQLLTMEIKIPFTSHKIPFLKDGT